CTWVKISSVTVLLVPIGDQNRETQLNREYPSPIHIRPKVAKAREDMLYLLDLRNLMGPIIDTKDKTCSTALSKERILKIDFICCEGSVHFVFVFVGVVRFTHLYDSLLP
ncbi:hypothetical protein ACJX0J_033745, partial [Zea mays]